MTEYEQLKLNVHHIFRKYGKKAIMQEYRDKSDKTMLWEIFTLAQLDSPIEFKNKLDDYKVYLMRRVLKDVIF